MRCIRKRDLFIRTPPPPCSHMSLLLAAPQWQLPPPRAAPSPVEPVLYRLCLGRCLLLRVISRAHATHSASALCTDACSARTCREEWDPRMGIVPHTQIIRMSSKSKRFLSQTFGPVCFRHFELWYSPGFLHSLLIFVCKKGECWVSRCDFRKLRFPMCTWCENRNNNNRT